MNDDLTYSKISIGVDILNMELKTLQDLLNKLGVDYNKDLARYQNYIDNADKAIKQMKLVKELIDNVIKQI